MHKVARIKIEGFRRLHRVDLSMRPLMVVIGANGVGKSSLLDALSILSASAAGKLNQMLGQMGGLLDILSRNKAREVRFLASMEVPGYQPLEYDFQIEPRGPGYTISRETLTQAKTGSSVPFKHIDSSYADIRYYDITEKKLVRRNQPLRPEWVFDPFESSLSQVPKMFNQPEELRHVLSSMTKYHVLDVSSKALVKLPQQMKPAYLPGPDGEDLIPYLYSLRETTKDCFEAIEDTLKTAFPGFESLNFPPAAAGLLSLTWKERQFKSPLYIHQLSEGTLRFLWLVSLLHSPNLSTVTMIDEPEVSLHPELLSILADLMRAASSRTQLIVATHSDRLVRFLEPKEVVVMDLNEEGFTSANWADSLDLDAWLDEYSLDEVWRMGRMGGRS